VTDDPPLRDPDALRSRAGVRGDPNRDQHFLVDDRVLDRLPTYLPADAAHVLEIGAGTGALTDRLLRRADRVTAIERDPDLAAFLEREFSAAIDADRLTVLAGDATAIDLPDFDASVSNLPYGASSEILFRLLPRRRPLVVMVQREFGERMAAGPEDDNYGRLSVGAQHYAAVEVVEPVPATAFDPRPAVESVIVRTTPRAPDYTVPDDDFYLRFVKALFTQRRKTLRNAIRNTTHISGITDAAAVLDAIETDLLDARPDACSPATFARLAQIATDHGAVEG
jgi:16S rRNA (adenine1518-N6/adenine1519-N6)-dimethyltransferase